MLGIWYVYGHVSNIYIVVGICPMTDKDKDAYLQWSTKNKYMDMSMFTCLRQKLRVEPAAQEARLPAKSEPAFAAPNTEAMHTKTFIFFYNLFVNLG